MNRDTHIKTDLLRATAKQPSRVRARLYVSKMVINTAIVSRCDDNHILDTHMRAMRTVATRARMPHDRFQLTPHDGDSHFRWTCIARVSA